MRLAFFALVFSLIAPCELLAAPAKSTTSANAPKQVLFVCTGNFFRSRFAEIAFNTLEKSPRWAATSRGLDTAHTRKTPISPLVPAELARRNIAPSPALERPPMQLTQADLDHADLVVLLDGEEHEPKLKAKFQTVSSAKLRSWSVHDSPKMNPADAFAAIWQQVEALVTELAH